MCVSGPFVRQVLAIATQMTRNPAPLLLPTFDMLDCPELESALGRSVRREHLVWAATKKNATMIKFLFDGFEDVHVKQMILPVLRSHGAALIKRFSSGLSIWNEESGGDVSECQSGTCQSTPRTHTFRSF